MGKQNKSRARRISLQRLAAQGRVGTQDKPLSRRAPLQRLAAEVRLPLVVYQALSSQVPLRLLSC